MRGQQELPRNHETPHSFSCERCGGFVEIETAYDLAWGGGVGIANLYCIMCGWRSGQCRLLKSVGAYA